MIQAQTCTRIENPAGGLHPPAVTEGIRVRQLQGPGQWVTSSGSDAKTACELQVTGNVEHGCGCLARLNDDPVCKHRASFCLLVGALELDPETTP
jgi:hypothetical protein